MDVEKQIEKEANQTEKIHAEEKQTTNSKNKYKEIPKNIISNISNKINNIKKTKRKQNKKCR